MIINIAVIISVIFFHVIILVVGIWVGKKKITGESELKESVEVMLAGRNLGMFVGIFTMTAIWVGGGYINGTAETLYNNGMVWCQAPVGYALSLIIGGFFFANKMREEGYVTMLDPFQDLFGNVIGGLLFIPAFLGEVFKSAAFLATFGRTMRVIADFDESTSIIVSAYYTLSYTFFGGLYSVAYTDVIQLLGIFVGLWLCIPFILVNPAVGSLEVKDTDWIGSVEPQYMGLYLDYGLVLVLGGIPWQVYFQRVLSSKSALHAQLLSYAAAVGCIVMAIPPMIIGAVAKKTAWDQTDYNSTLPLDEEQLVLLMVLKYMTPAAVSFVGLGAVSGTVLLSLDSSILSVASMFARNIYKRIIRKDALEKEIIWMMKGAVLLMGYMAMKLTVKYVFGLWYLASDLVYVMLFPQLLCAVHFKKFCNAYGSLTACIVGFLMRFLGGEEILGLPAVIRYPFFDEATMVQRFPFRTLSMLISLSTLMLVSVLTRWLFKSGRLPPAMDIFHCAVRIPENVL